MPTKMLSFLTCSILTLCISCSRTETPLTPEVLIGKWSRPDGGYILEIKSLSEDGDAEAAYFNPKPIHVESAYTAKSKLGAPIIKVVLRDAGYPGSTYVLKYFKEHDQLVGTYSQPANSQSFNVYFVRQEE
ncbi:MAG: hypothetical protein AAF984_00240 [Verrucomicrobiota bacterium]